jgi:predicted Zn-dependent protease
VDHAIASVLLLEKEPDFLSLPDPADGSAYCPVKRFDKETAYLSPDTRAANAKTIIEEAKANQLRSAGVYASGSWFIAIGNSRGLFVYHHESSAECSVTMEGQDSSGWGKAQSIRARRIDPFSLAHKAAQAAKLSATPIEISPGKYTVILPPSAVLDLLCFLWYDFSATSHKDKLSSLLGKVGTQVFGHNITIADDCSHALQAGQPFDGEGMPRKTVTLVERGVLKNLVYGRKSAKHFAIEPSGHGLPEPSPQGELAQNIVVAGGETSMDEMIESTDHGILLSRVWYVRLVDPASVLLTGMTRDGTFLIERGKISRGLINLRFNVSVLDLLNSVVQLGPSARTAGEEGAPSVVPAMKVTDFNFTSTTKF